MKSDQKYSPKYWVVHYTNTEDVVVESFCKSMNGSINKFESVTGEDFHELSLNGRAYVQLIEITPVAVGS